MELFFADDSGKDATKATYLFEAAVAFDESQMASLDAFVNDLRRSTALRTGTNFTGQLGI